MVGHVDVDMQRRPSEPSQLRGTCLQRPMVMSGSSDPALIYRALWLSLPGKEQKSRVGPPAPERIFANGGMRIMRPWSSCHKSARPRVPSRSAGNGKLLVWKEAVGGITNRHLSNRGIGNIIIKWPLLSNLFLAWTIIKSFVSVQQKQRAAMLGLKP